MSAALLIDDYFRWARFRARLRACLLAPHWDALIGTLRQRGYSHMLVYHTVRYGLRLAEFARQRGIHDVGGLTEKIVRQYHGAAGMLIGFSPKSSLPTAFGRAQEADWAATR